MWISRSPSPASTSYTPMTRSCNTKPCWMAVSRGTARGTRSIILCKSNAQDNGITVREGVENLVIVGSGPAGYTAAIYAARANLRPVVFEGYQVGGPRGGQLMTTSEVENFPGFPDGVTGPDLMDKMRAQAERWGSILFTEDVEFLDLKQRPFTIRSSENEVKANAVILATGANAKRLGLPSEEEYWNRGLSACAICDGSNPAFKQADVAVVGGGDTAVEEALYLTKYCQKVHLLVRGEKLRASKSEQDRVNRHEAVQIHYNISVKDVTGDKNGIQGLTLQHSQTGDESSMKVRGLFYGIGHQPNSHLFKDSVALDDGGYIRLQGGVATSVEGVFAAGDIFDKEYRQAITAAGSGCMAALSAERYLNEKNLVQEYHRDQEPEQTPLEAAQDGKPEPSKADIDVEAIKHAGQLALRKLYHESQRPIIVFYSAKTCGPCRTLKPILNGVIDEYENKVHLIDIDIDVDSEVAVAAGVQGTPTVQIFKNKALVQNLPGVKMKRDYRNFIGEALDLQN